MFNSNASSADAGGADYIEDVFSTWLYDGNGATQTITNGIDLAGEGGLVWVKNRNTVSFAHQLYDTNRGAGLLISSNSTSEQVAPGGDPSTGVAFTSSGFSVGSSGGCNASGIDFASWTFRKQPKFFDVVTYTGNGSNRTIAHNLGSAPGCVIVKCTSTTGQWAVWHRSGTQLNNFCAYLNAASAYGNAGAGIWGTNGGVPSMTSTTFSLGTDSDVNTTGETYVAYLFAHNAGGFGLTGTDNVISCGSYAGTGSPVFVNLGYEPQWVMIKNITTGGDGYNWMMMDNMRGIPTSGDTPILFANLSSAEEVGGQGNGVQLNATGFTVTSPFGALNNSGNTYIYIAIRRGPMKVPTDGTSVFAVDIANNSGTSTNPEFVSGFPVDAYFVGERAGANKWFWPSRLTGNNSLDSATTAAEASLPSAGFGFNTGVFSSGLSSGFYATMFRRAPGFFDEVCYTGTGATTTQTHNLAAVPELIIVKRRSGTAFWQVYSATFGRNFYAFLNDTQGFASDPGNAWGTTDPTTTTFSLSPLTETNASGSTYVAYLFATCPGVSKVGSYTGTAATQVINCGFTGGARFVLIKRTDSTGDWYVWDSARGIVAGNDPYLLLNSTAAEVTSTDYVDTAASGFELTATAPAAINASGGTYIFLAIA
jgi:hypothetical protein